MSRPILKVCPPELGFVRDEVLDYDVPGLEFEKPPRILDIGANIGAFTVWACERWPDCAFTAYEPHPDNFAMLVENVGPLGCIAAAVDDTPGTAKLYEGRNRACCSLERSVNQKADGVMVAVKSAKELPPCDVLKLDVEGAELRILRTYKHLAQCKAVLLEWHHLAERQEILKTLVDAGLVIHSETGRIVRALHPSVKVPEATQTGRKCHLFLSVLGWKLSPYHARSREALIVEAMKEGFDLTIHPDMTSGVDRSRNICIETMREKCPEATHHMFIDSDIAFDPHDLTIMMRSGFDVVGGAYPKKGINWANVAAAVRAGVPDDKLAEMANDFVVNAPNGKELHGMTDSTTGARFAEVDQLGTGFLMVKAEAIEKYIAHYRAEIEYQTNYEPRGVIHHTVFACELDPRSPREKAKRALLAGAVAGIELEPLAADYRAACALPASAGIYLTEDYAFCTRWQLMGGKVMLYLDAHLAHQGPMIYQGHLGHMFGAKEEAKTDA